MTKGTRYFLIGAIVVVTAGLATGLVAYYGGGLGIRALAGEPSEFAYLPSTSTAVAYADVRAIMNSEFRRRLRQVIPTGEEQERLKAETGIDIEKDIDTVVAGMAGQDIEKGGVVLIRGRFDNARIESVAATHGAVVETYKGKRLLLMGNRAQLDAAEAGSTHSGPVTGCLAFVEPGLLALGDAVSVRRAIDTGTSGDSVRKNADLMKLVGELSGSGNAWVVGRFDAFSQGDTLPSAVKDQLGAVQLMAASVRINGGVAGQLRAEARDDQAAEQLRDVVRGVLAAGRLMSGKDTRVDAVLNSFQLQGTGKTVTLSFTVPPEVFDILNGMAALRGLAPTGK
jgi:hypothetical protein